MVKPENVPQPMKDSLRGELVGILVGELLLNQEEGRQIDLGQFRKDVREFYSQYRHTALRIPTALVSWAATYNRLFGKVPELSGVGIPPKPEGVGPVRLIVVAKELVAWTGSKPIQGVQNALKKHFPSWQYTDDLDVDITTNDRDPKHGSYAIWVRDVREADEDLANMSANNLSEKQIACITTLERQLLEADYFWEHGEHLDIENVTLCAGSRDRDGRVPSARWRDAEFLVRWCDASSCRPRLRSRRVWV